MLLLRYPYYIVQEQRECIQKLKQKLIEQSCNIEKQLKEMQCKQMTLEKQLTELRIKSQSEEEEALAKLEEQHLLKELHPLIRAISNLQQKKDHLVDQHQCWIKALKYEIHKGEVWTASHSS